MCSADWEVSCFKWWHTGRIYCTDLHFLVHLVTMKICISECANCFSLLGEQQRYHSKEQPKRKCRYTPSPALDCFLLSWSNKMEGIPTSALSPVFSEGKVAIPSLVFTNISIQLMQALNSSLNFSYPVLETAFRISKCPRFSFVYDKLVFILNSKKVFVHEKLAQQLPIPSRSEEAMFRVKP